MTSPIYRFCLAALMLLAIVSFAAAQDYRGKVQGVITDENGAAVPGAHVVLRNIATGVEVARQTSDDGLYIFDFVEPGEYTVIADHDGFKKAIQEHVNVRVRGDISVDMKMAVGAVQESVTVEAPPIAVQFGSSSTLLTVENKVIDQLPIRGRNPYNVATLDQPFRQAPVPPQTRIPLSPRVCQRHRCWRPDPARERRAAGRVATGLEL